MKRRLYTILLLAMYVSSSYTAAGEEQRAPELEARAALSRGNYKRAVAWYDAALKSNPKSAQLLGERGLAYEMEGEHEAAIKNYSRALRIEETLRVKELLATERCRLRQYSEASTLLTEIAAKAEPGDGLLQILSPCYLELTDSLDALRVSETLTQHATMAADALLLYRSQSAMVAERYFIEHLSAASGGKPYLQFLKEAKDSGSRDARGGFPYALKHASYLSETVSLDEGLALLPTHSQDPALLYVLAVLAGEQAMQSVLECQQKFPESPRLLQFQARMLASTGHPEQASAAYSRLLNSDPDLPDLRHDAAEFYRKQADWGRTLEICRALLKSDPEDERAVTGISESLIQMGQFADAEAFLSRRLSKSGAPLWASLDLSLADQKLGKVPEAIAVLSRAEKEHPLEKTIHFRLMRLYAQAGQQAKAEKERTLFALAEKSR